MTNENFSKLTRVRKLLAKGSPMAQYLGDELQEILSSEGDPCFGLEPAEAAMLRNGRVYVCIKSVRARKMKLDTAFGLKEAKELVENAGDKMGLRPNGAWSCFR
jgi:hypothetical protein